MSWVVVVVEEANTIVVSMVMMTALKVVIKGAVMMAVEVVICWHSAGTECEQRIQSVAMSNN